MTIALAKEPAGRFATGAAFSAALRDPDLMETLNLTPLLSSKTNPIPALATVRYPVRLKLLRLRLQRSAVGRQMDLVVGRPVALLVCREGLLDLAC